MKPVKVRGVDLAFGGDMKVLMPPMKDIPEDFHRGITPFNKLFCKIFYCGGKFTKLTPREGIDKSEALNHIMSIAGSFYPKHEEKEAACAYLFSLWFEPDFEFEAKPMKLKV